MKKIITLFAATIISIGAFAQWDTLTTNTAANFNSISFTNENNGVAVGKNQISLRGVAYQTTDGGISWSLVNTGTPSYNDVFFQSNNTGWIAADSGFIMESSNSGQTWGTWAHIGTKNFNCIFFPTDTVGYVGGDDGILYRTADFGASWDTLNSGTNLSINDLFFADALNGWIVGDGGYMATTADGGQTWIQVGEPYFGFFNCSGFASAGTSSNTFAVGNSGDLIHSSDGGLTWNALSSNTTSNLNSVRFTNNLAGIVCGDHGKILRTQDGGLSWYDETMSTVTENLTGVSWASDTLAYICGANGRILKSHIDISSVHSGVANTFEISAFPNPFAEELNIIVDLQKNSSVTIVIFDLSGRVVMEENEGEMNSGKHVVRTNGISSLVSGMYFVKVTSGNGELVIPVVNR